MWKSKNFGLSSWEKKLVKTITNVISTSQLSISRFHEFFIGICSQLQLQSHSVLWKLRKFSLISRIFGKNFVKVTVLLKITKELTKFFFGEREFLAFPHCESAVQCHSVEITEILSRSRIFGKNFVKVTILLKSWFDEIFFGESRFLNFPHSVVSGVVMPEFYPHCTSKNRET